MKDANSGTRRPVGSSCVAGLMLVGGVEPRGHVSSSIAFKHILLERLTAPCLNTSCGWGGGRVIS